MLGKDYFHGSVIRAKVVERGKNHVAPSAVFKKYPGKITRPLATSY